MFAVLNALDRGGPYIVPGDRSGAAYLGLGELRREATKSFTHRLLEFIFAYTTISNGYQRDELNWEQIRMIQERTASLREPRSFSVLTSDRKALMSSLILKKTTLIRKKTTNLIARTTNRIKQIDLDTREQIHFLHVGKNAGTEIRRYADVINQKSKNLKIIKHGHDEFLRNIPSSDRYFFSIRDPIARFKSGFYSRKRKGLPKQYSEWSRYDRVAFENFEHANDLAEALFRNDELGRKAIAAIKSIRHTAQNQVDWFYCFGNLFSVRPPIAVIRQENFEEDIALFQSLIGVDEPFILERDKIDSHFNSYDNVPDLSQKAIANLKTWYAQDFAFYDLCDNWIEKLHSKSNT